MDRNDIHIIGRHSNWSYKGIEKVLKDEIYSDGNSWKKFLQILFIALGTGFTISGIIFFFAYNWDGLHKFAKIGMIEALVIALTLTVLFSKLTENIKNIILTGTAVLIGVLFAVFGQIYQTGANAYDFFLGWTFFITLWVVVSNYPPMWLVYMLLINTTFVLYIDQFAQHWDEVLVINTLIFFNSLFLVFFLLIPKLNGNIRVPLWFSGIIALAIATLSTFAISLGIFNGFDLQFILLISLSAILYAAGIFYGLKIKSGFYLSIIPFSLIVIFSSWLIKISDGATMFFVVGLFIIASVTVLIKGLLYFQKKWTNG